MRIFNSAFLFLIIVLCGCSYPEKSVEAQITENNMNLPDLKPIHIYGITFDLSSILVKDNYQNITVKAANDNSFSSVDYSIRFSVEQFTNSELTTIQFVDTIQQNTILTLQNYYIQNIVKDKFTISEPDDLLTKVGKKGFIQTVMEYREDKSYGIQYLIATVSIKGKYFVFQLVSSKQISPFLYDDFLTILKSVR
ncbi:MAG: hypothetical protein M9916_10705 [Crocinitomicaceae bacterium]|nr:hypothetical protein [Crocinitomicaceae bacterium]